MSAWRNSYDRGNANGRTKLLSLLSSTQSPRCRFRLLFICDAVLFLGILSRSAQFLADDTYFYLLRFSARAPLVLRGERGAVAISAERFFCAAYSVKDLLRFLRSKELPSPSRSLIVFSPFSTLSPAISTFILFFKIFRIPLAQFVFFHYLCKVNSMNNGGGSI